MLDHSLLFLPLASCLLPFAFCLLPPVSCLLPSCPPTFTRLQAPRKRRCGVSAANWPATKTHIHPTTVNQNSPWSTSPRTDPGQGRAATDSDTCQLSTHGNTRPPIPAATVHTVTVVIARGSHSAMRPWAIARCVAVTQPPPRSTTTHTHPPWLRLLSLPFPTRSPSGVHSVP